MLINANSKKILLVVTGSVAAIKTIDLIKNLKGYGMTVTALLTESAKRYNLVNENEVCEVSENPVLTIFDFSGENSKSWSVLNDSDAVLVSPSSANFMKRMVVSDILGTAIVQSYKLRIISPAMNVRMWRHPAVQRNVRSLLKTSWHFLGPVEGKMACGEYGLGRMMRVDDIGKGVNNLIQGNTHKPELELYKKALIPNPSLITGVKVSATKSRKVLLIVHGAKDAENTGSLVERLKANGCHVTCVLSKEARQFISMDKLTELSGNIVYTEHYQEDEQGMEHITLSREADLLLIAPAAKNNVKEMAEGGASDLVGDIYLATDKPVFVLPSRDPEQTPLQKHLELIKSDGAKALNIDYNDGQHAENIALQINSAFTN